MIPGQVSTAELERELERRRKISRALIGLTRNPSGLAGTPEAEAERRRKISESLRGRTVPGRGWPRGRKRGPQSPEHRARIAAATRERWEARLTGASGLTESGVDGGR